MNTNTFSIINYLDADFETLKERLKLILRSSDIYKDYDFEGSNISTLIEMCSYLGDLNAFYVNKLANNIMPETTDVYEVAHSHARRAGYEPKGYVSSKVQLNVRISQSITSWDILPKFKDGDNIVIPKGYEINSGVTTIEGDAIYYIVSDDISFDVTVDNIQTLIVNNVNTAYYIDIPVLAYQGSISSTMFTSDDIIDSRIYLENVKYDHTDGNTFCSLIINGEIWTRVSNPFDTLNIVQDLTVDKNYMLRYDKYGRYYLWFFGNNSPIRTGNINFICNDSLGVDGTIGSNATWEKTATQEILGDFVNFLYNTTTYIPFNINDFEITNQYGSYGASNPENIVDLTTNSQNMIYTQNRNVTYKDFQKNLENLETITNACVYGEYEARTGTTVVNIYDFNRVYSAILTKDFEVASNPFTKNIYYLPTAEQLPTFYENVTNVITTTYPLICQYTTAFDAIMNEYNINKSLIGISMILKAPNLVRFSFDIGLRIKKQYVYSNVEADIKNKLAYYFSKELRNFGDEIDFRDITNFIIDTDIVSESDRFPNVMGISSFTIRDIHVFYPFSYESVFTSGVNSSTVFDLGNRNYSFEVYNNDNNIESMVDVKVGDLFAIGDDMSGKFVTYGTVESIDITYFDIEETLVNYYTIIIKTVEILSVDAINNIQNGYFWIEKIIFDVIYTQDGLTKYNQNYKNFPYYVIDNDYGNNSSNFSNTSMTVQLGFDQFPMLALEYCNIYNEGIK